MHVPPKRGNNLPWGRILSYGLVVFIIAFVGLLVFFVFNWLNAPSDLKR